MCVYVLRDGVTFSGGFARCFASEKRRAFVFVLSFESEAAYILRVFGYYVEGFAFVEIIELFISI